MAKHIVLIWLAAAVLAKGFVARDDSTCTSQDCLEVDSGEHGRSHAMLQVQARRNELANEAVLDVTESGTEYVWSSEAKASPALHYFKWWSAGGVKHAKAKLERSSKPAVLFQKGAAKGKRTLTSVKALLSEHEDKVCGPSLLSSLLSTSSWAIHSQSKDDAEVEHVLLRSSAGDLQYAAVFSDSIVAMDPKVCSRRSLAMVQHLGNETEGGGGRRRRALDSRGPAIGEPVILHVDSDPLVADCVNLFHRTAKANCSKDFDVEVLSAQVAIIDGFAVSADIQVNAASGNSYYHTIECDFEFPYTPDASLLQSERRHIISDSQPGLSSEDDILPEERDGLQASLTMLADICAADSTSSSDDEGILSLMSEYKFGYLSPYKGYEYLREKAREDVPMFIAINSSQTPETYDMRTAIKECFPQNGKEVVRDQGKCGSCWAFGSSSTLMHNICKSGKGDKAMNSASDRMEVSVQGLMSCNSYKEGCKDGHYDTADETFRAKGVGKEKDFSYKCKGGSCKKGNNWGSPCEIKKNPQWTYHGMLQAPPGEAGMMATLVQSGSGLTPFSVCANFMKYKSGIYSSCSGGKKGGHAVPLVAYGAEGGKKYWTIQNSWGTKFGKGGYVDFKRGENLCGIEDGMFVFQGYVQGAPAPPPIPPRPGKPAGGGGAAPAPAPAPVPGPVAPPVVRPRPLPTVAPPPIPAPPACAPQCMPQCSQQCCSR